MTNVAILGASGYSGAELVHLLSRRKDVAIRRLFASSSAGREMSDLYPALSGRFAMTLEPSGDGNLRGIDVAFVALPSGEGMKAVPHLLSSVERVIDLGGDFRLPSAGLYEQFYNHVHTAPELLTQAVYGLPEINRAEIASARFIANPGCYPTGAILALYPALMHGLIREHHIVINSLSGASGAGRSASEEMGFAELNENVRAYKIGTHQHTPEIEWTLSSATGKDVRVSFVPHLIPITRGIYTTIHADLEREISAQEMIALYRQSYSHEPCIRIREHIPQIKHVLNSNYCDINIAMTPRTGQMVITSVIDNLVKGAAGQAVQNMNIMLGLPDELGLA